jgi:hypothetical protein
MGKLLPVRHPNRDFFILDVSDTNARDDLASMEHPIFSLSTKPDMRSLTYESTSGLRLQIAPSSKGLATIMDKDVLLYCISKLVAEKNAGRQISQVVEMSGHEIMLACNWRTNDAGYQRLRDALFRLRGTQITTDIATGGVKPWRVFGLIEFGEVVPPAGIEPSAFEAYRMGSVRVKLSDWVFKSIEKMEVLSINRQYFRLRRPLERRLYELARKHVGTKNQAWTIGIEKLREKVGTNAPLKKFRFNLKEIIRDGNVPDYGFALQGDNVVMQRLVPVQEVLPEWIPLRPDTLDKAQKIAASLGVSVFDLEREWNEWAQAKGEKINAPDGAFIAFCQQKQGSRHAGRYVDARKAESEARQLGLGLPALPYAKRK